MNDGSEESTIDMVPSEPVKVLMNDTLSMTEACTTLAVITEAEHEAGCSASVDQHICTLNSNLKSVQVTEFGDTSIKVELPSPTIEIVPIETNLVSLVHKEKNLSSESESGDKDNKQYMIVYSTRTDNLEMGTLVESMSESEYNRGGTAWKRFRMQAEDGQSYILTVTEPDDRNGANVSCPAEEHKYTTKQASILTENASKSLEKRNQLLKSDVSQAWFTTRDDKTMLQTSGATWKQGQWTKDEVDILQSNIANYCRENGINDPTEIIFEMSKDERKQFYRTVAKGLQRPLFSVYRRVTRMYDQKNHMGKYSAEEIMRLRELRAKNGSDWATIGQIMGRSASSVKDKCRLMKDTCHSGKWLPEEEKRLSQAVYDLAGTRPGEDIVHGLSWAQVAERVMTRSEKQCRTKWLNYMNWKMKGGKEWTRDNDISLIIRISDLGVNDDSEIDWDDLATNWESARSPQWLRGKWWSLKRHIPDYQMKTFNELLENMKLFYLQNVRVQAAAAVDTTRAKKSESSIGELTYVPISISGLTGEDNNSLDEITSEPQAYEVLQLPNTNSSSYIITRSQTIISDHIIVQTVPISHISDSDLGHVVIRVPSSSDLGDSGVNSLEVSDLTTLQLAESIDSSHQDLESLAEDGVITQSDSLNEDSTFSSHNLEESVISSPDDGINKHVQTLGDNNGQLMTSFADPMLNSDSNSLMGPASDSEVEKGHTDDIIIHME